MSRRALKPEFVLRRVGTGSAVDPYTSRTCGRFLLLPANSEGTMGIEQIGVIGAGVMGSEIAQVAAAAGCSVVMVDIDDAAVARGMGHIRAIGDRRVARGRMTEDDAQAIAARVSTAITVDAVGDCDLVIEAGPELLDLKLDLWRAIDAAAPARALLASNTSGLSITTLARATRRPDQVMGLHFFNPASVMRLVEVIRGGDTSEATLAAGVALAERLGKAPVRVTECPGFLVNRILVRALAEAYRHADELGADRGSVDTAVVELGPAPMGPFALGDLIGLDTTLHVQGDLVAAYGDRFAAGTSLATQVGAGRLGQKSGAGFVAGSDPGVADRHGPAVAERYYLGAFDEACRCLEDGIAALPDIDLAMQLGTGWSNGPFASADARGLATVAADLERLAAASGERFAPRPPLRERLAGGTLFTPTTTEAPQ
jgi:3-hydroxybutyryl-CoA dehydrogenase